MRHLGLSYRWDILKVNFVTFVMSLFCFSQSPFFDFYLGALGIMGETASLILALKAVTADHYISQHSLTLVPVYLSSAPLGRIKNYTEDFSQCLFQVMRATF